MSTKDDLLAILEVQGAQFLKSFDRLKRSNDDTEFLRTVKPRITQENEVDEWTGFTSNREDEPGADLSHTISTDPESCSPQVVTFSESTPIRSTTHSRSRTFMSSKVSKLKQISTDFPDKKSDDEEGSDQDISNLKNDALLHRLVHTKLLSGSSSMEPKIAPAQRRKALAGRVSELAGHSKLGKGEILVRRDEQNRAAKRVREGMIAKQKEREVKSLVEAKNAGNYHPALKKLFAATSSGGQQRKRDRGLKMGVGRFSGGMLKLTSEEISNASVGQSSRGRHPKGKKR